MADWPAKRFLLLCNQGQGSDTDCRVKRRGAHGSENQIGLRDRSRDEARCNSFEVYDHDSAISVLLLKRPHDVGLTYIGPNQHSGRELGAVGPDRDRTVWVTIKDCHRGAGVSQLRPEND